VNDLPGHPPGGRKKWNKLSATLNISQPSASNGLMSHPKLLKAPARRLLLTFVMTAGVTVAINVASPRIAPRPAHGQHATTTVRPRARPAVDYSQIEGIQRWGLNE
jgi:hypothetical protein